MAPSSFEVERRLKAIGTTPCFATVIAVLGLLCTACGGGNGSSTGTASSQPPPPLPSISAVAPANVTVGIQLTTIDVLGANFDTSAVVLVDGQPALNTVELDSGTLQVTVDPSLCSTVGTHQFTVQLTTGGSNASPLNVYAPQQGPLVMNAIPSYLVRNETTPASIVVGDTNGDGFADALVPLWSTNQIAIMDGNADGSLSPAQFLSIPQIYALAVGDINGDGNADLVAISSNNAFTTTVVTLLGDGHGNFQQASSPQTFSGIFPGVVGIEDIDGDGQPDLVLYAEQETGIGYNLVWLRNIGQGNFAAAITLAQPAYSFLALADFNGDGKPDLIYPVLNTSTGITVLHMLLNTGGGQFTDQVVPGLNGISGPVTVLDFNLDGIPDLVVQQTQVTATTMYSFLGNGDGSFTQLASTPLIASYQFVAGDFDHDGLPDLAGQGDDQILYLFGDGHGNFTPLTIAGPGGSAIAVGDINGDGLPDLVAPDYSNFLSVSLGRKDRNFPFSLTLTPTAAGFIVLGDINGDGLPEIFVAGVIPPPPAAGLPGTVFMNQGNNSFQFAANTNPLSFAIRDLTGKGVVDLIGTNDDTLVIWPNNGTMSFSPSPVTVPTNSSVQVIDVADIDGDGHPDIVTPTEILFGNGAYQFTPLPLTIGSNFVVGDFNGDGRPDILAGSNVLLNTGNRTFQTVPTNVPSGFSMGVGDFNGDGKDDLVLNDGGPIFQIWYSRGDGTFYQASLLDVGQYAGSYSIGDFNGDGRLDLGIGLYLSDQVAMAFNQGNGQFSLSYFAMGVQSYSMRAGDLNGNGKLGLVVEEYPSDLAPPKVNVVFHQ